MLVWQSHHNILSFTYTIYLEMQLIIDTLYLLHVNVQLRT